MKGYFYTRQYDSCRNIMDILEPLLEYIPKTKFDLFIKLKSKIMIYQLILEFIYNHLDESFDAVIGMIKYLSQNDIFTLEEKTKKIDSTLAFIIQSPDSFSPYICANKYRDLTRPPVLWFHTKAQH